MKLSSHQIGCCRGWIDSGRRRNRGFTLIEVITVLSVIAVLTTLAVPSFSRLIANQRDKAIASELYVALNKTRSEALTRNLNVTLSAKGADWASGWTIVSPTNAAVVLEERGAVIGATVSGPSSPASVTFTPSGRLPQGTTVPVFVVTATAQQTSFYQCISVDLSGRPYMQATSTC